MFHASKYMDNDYWDNYYNIFCYENGNGKQLLETISSKIKMKIQFIQPSIGKMEGRKYIKSWQMQPLPIATLLGMTPCEYQTSFTDDRFEDIDYTASADLIAMPIETYTAKRTYEISRRFREKGITVIMGGIHAMLEPEEVSHNSDSVCVSGAETVWQQMLNDFKNGQLKKFYREENPSKVLMHTQPDRSIFRGKPYLPLEIIETGRGCGNSCDFCAVQMAHGSRYRSKTIDDIVSDVQSAEGKNVYFADDNFVSDFRRTKELCKRLEPLGKKWFSHGSINMADDPELLRLLERSGCVNLLIGFETLNQETLRQMGKAWNTAKRTYEESIGKIRDSGLTIYASFCFGYDNDTKDDFKRAFDFAMEQKFGLTAFNHLVPYPNTPLYHRLRKEGRLFEDKWWLREGYRFGEVVFRPKNMSAEDLAETCYEYRKQYYRLMPMLGRMSDFKANSKDLYNFFGLWIANLSSKKAVEERQYWEIGGSCQDVKN